MADPRTTITRICSAVGEPKPALDFLEGFQTAHLSKGHTVAGNPMRFQAGSVPIRPDMEWVERNWAEGPESSRHENHLAPTAVLRLFPAGRDQRGNWRRFLAAERCMAERDTIALSEGRHRG